MKALPPSPDLTPPGIKDSEFTRSLFLLRMQIALEEIRERVNSLTDPEEIALALQELEASEQFYEQYLSSFN